MRVLLWGINYAPEPTGIAPYLTGLAEHLHARGCAVTAVTGFPYYPAWRKEEADCGRLFRRDTINGVTVHRCWQYVPARVNTPKRMLHEATFVATSLWRVLWLKRPDVYVVASPPLGLGLAVALVSFLKGRPYLFQVHDLQPDSANELGMMKPGLLLRLLYACERIAYRYAAGVGGVSAGMTAAFAAKGVPAEKIFLLPNWRRGGDGRPVPVTAAARFRRRYGIEAEDFLAVYSGNLGRKQGLMVMLDAAELLAAHSGRRRIIVLIAGDGAEQPALARRLQDRPLVNVRLLPLQSDADHAAMLQTADIALITQAAGTGQVCFPSKLLSVLAVGCPVISAADDSSDLARAVREGGFGRNVPAGDAAALAQTLVAAADNEALLAGWKARTGWVDRFSAPAMLARLETVIRSLAGDRPDGPPNLVSLSGENQS